MPFDHFLQFIQSVVSLFPLDPEGKSLSSYWQDLNDFLVRHGFNFQQVYPVIPKGSKFRWVYPGHNFCNSGFNGNHMKDFLWNKDHVNGLVLALFLTPALFFERQGQEMSGKGFGTTIIIFIRGILLLGATQMGNYQPAVEHSREAMMSWVAQSSSECLYALRILTLDNQHSRRMLCARMRPKSPHLKFFVLHSWNSLYCMLCQICIDLWSSYMKHRRLTNLFIFLTFVRDLALRGLTRHRRVLPRDTHTHDEQGAPSHTLPPLTTLRRACSVI